MKLVCSWNKFHPSSFSFSSYRALRVLLYSTKTVITSTPCSTSRDDTLYRRIFPLGDPWVSIVPVLDKWIGEGKTISKEQLRSMIKEFKVYKRFSHALRISQWMSDRFQFVLLPGDIAVRVDLISRVHGLEEAEKYFTNIPKESTGFYTYCALLNCYALERSVEKAEALMQKMRDLGFATTSLSDNVMLNLYSQFGQYEKLDMLLQEMKEKGIPWDKFTFSTCLSASAATPNIDEMEDSEEDRGRTPGHYGMGLVDSCSEWVHQSRAKRQSLRNVKEIRGTGHWEKKEGCL